MMHFPFAHIRSHQKNIVLKMYLHVFTPQKNDYVFRYLFWYWLLMGVGIDLQKRKTTILALISCFSTIDLLMMFLYFPRFVWIVDQNGVPKWIRFSIEIYNFPQVVLLGSPWLSLADLGNLLVPLAPFWYPFGILLVAFWCYFVTSWHFAANISFISQTTSRPLVGQGV